MGSTCTGWSVFPERWSHKLCFGIAWDTYQNAGPYPSPLGPEAEDQEQAALSWFPGRFQHTPTCEAHSQGQIKGFPAAFIIDVHHRVDGFLAGV